jgi:hypothetical protein
MSRVPRFIAKDLIQFAKSVQVTANYFDPQARAAFEFARQMASPKLKKINPQFECTLNPIENKEPAQIKAEFLDGTSWTADVSTLSAAQLRFEFYRRAGDAEDNMDGSPADAAAGAAGKGKADAKGGKGKK